MNRYFIYDNANRKIKVGKFTFLFDVVESVGGAWRGVLKLSEADEIAALLTLPPSLGIRELTELEYNEQLKKKTPSARRAQPQLIRTPQFQEGDRAVAVVVGAPGSRPTKGEHENKEPAKAPLEKVLKVGKAPFIDPLEVKPASKKKQKVSKPMYTWLQTKNGIKSLLTDFTPSDELFVAAVACYVKAAVSREVDKDLELHKSYMTSFKDFKLRLIGFTSSLVAGGTLDVEVKKLLTVDANRQGLSNFVTLQIALGAQEITTMDVMIEELMRQAAIDLQTHIVAYRCNNETIYTNSDIVAFGQASRGKFPEGGRVLDAFYERQVPALAESVAYVATDLVLSNGHVYEVITGGTIGIGDLGSGLTDTTGAVQYIDGLAFVYRYEENALRMRMRQSAWKDRVRISAMLDGCCTRGEPATIAVEEEAHSFYGWPGLIDTDYVYRLVWNGIKFDFVDGSLVPFDEPFQLAASDFVKAKLMREMGMAVTAIERRELSYAQRRAQLYSFHHSRALLVND